MPLVMLLHYIFAYFVDYLYSQGLQHVKGNS
uniref:Uncharacterized protein n=1 Tax=Arundo donax TaxID=35708 RepID=A0A0A9GP32_ARUDO